MARQFYLLILALLSTSALMTGGCATKSTTVTNGQQLPGLVGRRVAFTGTAFHSCPGAVVFGTNNISLFIDGLKYWPADFDRHQLKVAGILTQQNQPDLYVLRDASWSLLP